MESVKLSTYLFIINILLIFPFIFGKQSYCYAEDKVIPVIVTTWRFQNATEVAWNTIYNYKGSAIDAIENGCSNCEDNQCDGTVGYGSSPDENGETTLDAMLMDGTTMDMGGVACLRNVKHAISVARHVLESTSHSLLVGELATNFAIKMGFRNESLQTDKSHDMWQEWRNNNCQPNYWKNVVPNPTTTCGPYHPKRLQKVKYSGKFMHSNSDNHDTIGMLAIDKRGQIAAGTSTNGMRNKIPGRVGDSPIPGAGAYADQEVGAAAATGDGDIMMRFLPSFLAVEMMRLGHSPRTAAEIAIKRIIKHYPKFSGAVITLSIEGEYAAACHGMDRFPFYVANLHLGKPTMFSIPCVSH